MIHNKSTHVHNKHNNAMMDGEKFINYARQRKNTFPNGKRTYKENRNQKRKNDSA